MEANGSGGERQEGKGREGRDSRGKHMETSKRKQGQVWVRKGKHAEAEASGGKR